MNPTLDLIALTSPFRSLEVSFTCFGLMFQAGNTFYSFRTLDTASRLSWIDFSAMAGYLVAFIPLLVAQTMTSISPTNGALIAFHLIFGMASLTHIMVLIYSIHEVIRKRAASILLPKLLVSLLISVMFLFWLFFAILPCVLMIMFDNPTIHPANLGNVWVLLTILAELCCMLVLYSLKLNKTEFDNEIRGGVLKAVAFSTFTGCSSLGLNLVAVSVFEGLNEQGVLYHASFALTPLMYFASIVLLSPGCQYRFKPSVFDQKGFGINQNIVYPASTYSFEPDHYVSTYDTARSNVPSVPNCSSNLDSKCGNLSSPGAVFQLYSPM